jgi:endo-1,4-beta-xylanase
MIEVKQKKYIEIINILKRKSLIAEIGIQCHQFNIDSLSASSISSVLSLLVLLDYLFILKN